MKFRLFLIVMVFLMLPVKPAQASTVVVGTGSPMSCTESAFFNGLNSIVFAGTLSFNCGGPATITLSSQAVITEDVTILGDSLITLSGGNTTRLFSIVTGGKLTLQDLQLTNGFVVGNGGAIRNFGELVLDNTIIRNSRTDTDYSGGAIFSYGKVSIFNSLFEDNLADHGGALALLFEEGDAVISDSRLSYNRTLHINGMGGGILLVDGADLTLHSTVIADNFAAEGGGIHNAFSNSSITIDQGSLIESNQNQHGDTLALKGGAGIYNEGSLLITDSTLRENNSSGNGGGINNLGTAELTRVTIHDNVASNGGGIYNSGNLSLTNVTLTKNNWWGLFTSGLVTATNVTFSDNGSSNILANLNTITLKNVVLKQDSASGYLNCDETGGVINSVGYNLSSDNSCQFNQSGDQNAINPMLGELANNGGLT